jgi:DNA-binding response OmpR family regulator
MAKILLIDDDPALLDVLALAFEDAGHEVLTAPDGLRGLRGAEEQCPALIVSDVNMPGLDGFSLCRRLRERGDQTPLILLTSRESEIDEALGLELGPSPSPPGCWWLGWAPCCGARRCGPRPWTRRRRWRWAR